jgi:hypothetical protein
VIPVGLLIAAAGLAGSPTTIPSFGTAAQVGRVTGGACNGGATDPDAQIQVTWAINSPDNTNYSITVLENGSVIQSGLACNASTFTKTITNFVETTQLLAPNEFQSNWTYTVQLVRISDGVVIASSVTSAWIQTYATCS